MKALKIVLLLLVALLCGCDSIVVFEDKFDSSVIGNPPPPPKIGTSSIKGDVVIAENPLNDISSDLWLQLRRPNSSSELAEYEGTFTTVIKRGKVALEGYIPSFNPIPMSLYFNPPSINPDIPILHIDLRSNGDIRLNDNTVLGTYKFNHPIDFVIDFNLEASPPTATVSVTGEGLDVNTTVNILPVAAGFGLQRINIVTPFEGSGRFFINRVFATKRD